MKTFNKLDDYKNIDIKYLIKPMGEDKALWAMVILQALKDINLNPSKHISKEEIKDAHKFLSGSNGMLELICSKCNFQSWRVKKTYNEILNKEE